MDLWGVKPFRIINLHSDFVQFPPIFALQMLDDVKNSVLKPLFVGLGGDVLDLLNDEAFWSALFNEVH